MTKTKQKSLKQTVIQLSRSTELEPRRPINRDAFMPHTTNVADSTHTWKLTPYVVSGSWVIVAVAVCMATLLLASPQSRTIGLRRPITTSNSSQALFKKSPVSYKKQSRKPASLVARTAPLVIPAAILGKCTEGTTMNIVAHEDDDLLFINPDITRSLARGDCIRTVYLTAGDDGRGLSYLRQREAGAEAAYDVMLGNTKPWQSVATTMQSGETVTIASPDGNAMVSLIFLRLPDGNLDGNGFSTTGFQSLARLWAGSNNILTTVDGQNSYDSAQLTATLGQLMDHYHPIHINTQADDAGQEITDHSDHIATGQYAGVAAKDYAVRAQLSPDGLISYYQGYPIRGLPDNLNAADSQQKANVFFAYAADDPNVCVSIARCKDVSSSYGAYLARQYTQTAR